MADKLYEEADIQAIAAAIKSKSGNDATMKVSQMASRINGIQTEGGNEINAPGGTATAGDMARGKTAYVENNLLTGNVETAESGNTKTLNRGTVRYSSGTGTVKVPVFIFKSGANTKQLLFREGSYAEFDALASQFGDAEDANVLSGKTYTSKNGFAKTGTHVCSQPSGTIEITTNGTHNVSSYATANVNVASTSINVEMKTVTFTLDTDAESYDIVTGLNDIIAFEAHTTEPGSGSGRTIFKFSSVQNNNTAILKDASGSFLTYIYANTFNNWTDGGTIKAQKLIRTSNEYLLAHGTWELTAIGI